MASSSKAAYNNLKFRSKRDCDPSRRDCSPVISSLSGAVQVVTINNPPVNFTVPDRSGGARLEVCRHGGLDQVLADIGEFAQEAPLFWKPSPLLVDLVARGADAPCF